MYDLLIKNGLVFMPDCRFDKVNLAIKDGKIVAVVQDEPQAAKVIDAKGRHVVPGAIDPHVHLGFSNPYAEDFRTETRSAAIGGITTIFNYYRNRRDYYETIPPLIKEAESTSMIDFGFNLGIITREHFDKFPQYRKDLGVKNFKLYTIYSRIVDSFFAYDGVKDCESLQLDTGDFMAIFERAAEQNVDCVFNIHAENVDMIREATRKIKDVPNKGLDWFAQSRPDIAETQEVISLFYLARHFGVNAYIVHTSAGTTIKAIEDNPYLQGDNLMIETCPQYLATTVENPSGGLAKVIPPIRYQKDNDIMWEGIEKGIVDTLASDNAPYTLEGEGYGKPIDEMKVGFASYATNYTLLLDEGYQKRGVPLEKLVQLISTNTAKIYGVYPQKGCLGVGSDADIAILDLDKEQVITAGILESSQPFTIYEGRRTKGWPVMTISKGQVIMEDGKIVGKAGTGRYLAR